VFLIVRMVKGILLGWKQLQQRLKTGRTQAAAIGEFDGLVSVPRREKRGVYALTAGCGSNLLSASIAGEDELHDDGFDQVAATHLAHHRNESGIRRSRFVLSPNASTTK
jgi:hypothetical protein